jgi:hypothetical protein
VHSSRRQARGRTRILYWFRTPPGVRVGRAALDESAIRFIEEHHPDIRFDWAQILSGEAETPAARGRAPHAGGGRPEPPTDSRPDPPVEPVSAAHAHLGSEGLARLRGRYGEIMVAIGRRVPDPERREQLKIEAERLNPDGWVTDEEVRLGLEQYEAVLGSVRASLGPRRRRRRGRPGGSGPPLGDTDHGPPDDSPGQVQPEHRDGPETERSQN